MKKMYKKYQVCAIYIVMAISLSGCKSCKEVPELKIFDAVEITPVSAKVTGSVISEGSDPVIEYGICFSTLSNPTISDKQTVNKGPAGGFTNVLSGLVPNTSYYAKAYATNSAGTGYSNDEILFTTGQDLFSSAMESYPGEFFFQTICGTSTPGIGEGFNAGLTDEEYSSASHSVEISRSVSDPCKVLGMGKDIADPIPVGRNLTLEVSVKGLNLEGRGISLAIRCDSPNGMKQFVTTENNIPILGTFNWTKYSVTLVNVQSDISNIIIYLIYLNNTSGTLYLDDVRLKVN